MGWTEHIVESRLARTQYQSKSCTQQDKKKIAKLIQSIKEDGILQGLGKPESLKHYDSPAKYSRRINKSDRMVYDVYYDKETKLKTLRIHTYKFHYSE